MTTEQQMCAGCGGRIDPAFDMVRADRRGRWHATCFVRAHSAGRDVWLWVVCWPWAFARLVGRSRGWSTSAANVAGAAFTVLVVALVLGLTASASAASGTEAGMFVGRQVWGDPACGQPHVEVSTPTDYQIAHGTGYFDGDPLAWADETRCVIVLNPDFKIRTAVKRCHVIVHEWGHLAGHEHSTNPRSVMYGEDLVAEGRERIGRRVQWEAAGAFKPCYLAASKYTGLG